MHKAAFTKAFLAGYLAKEAVVMEEAPTATERRKFAEAPERFRAWLRGLQKRWYKAPLAPKPQPMSPEGQRYHAALRKLYEITGNNVGNKRVIEDARNELWKTVTPSPKQTITKQ